MSQGRLVIAANDVFQQNMCMKGYIKMKWFDNSWHSTLEHITYLVAKDHIASFPAPPSGVALHNVWLLFVALP